MQLKFKKPGIIEIIFFGIAVLSCALIGAKIATNPLDTLATIGFITLLVLIWSRPQFGLFIALFLPIIGELYRVPLGSGGGLIISDFFIPVFVILWIIKQLINKKTIDYSGISSVKYMIIFAIFAVFSLILSLFFLAPKEVLSGSLYLIRLLSYWTLAIISFNEINTESKIKKIISGTIVASLILAAAGFIQLVIFPNLTTLEQYGWDPHMMRLVSTWLDPNFIGGYFAFIITLLIALIIYSSDNKSRFRLGLAMLGLAPALFLTYSRSAYLALGMSILIIGLIKSRKLLITCTILFFLAIATSDRAAQRVNDMVGSFITLIAPSAESPDPTARLRLEAWNETLQLINRHPLTGSGYNTLKYVKHNQGMVVNTNLHSASGSDSSLLTILATTGIIGLIPFLLIYFSLLHAAYLIHRAFSANHEKKTFYSSLGLGFFAATIGLILHSTFVNSLLFAQILIPFWIIAGIIMKLSSDPKLRKH